MPREGNWLLQGVCFVAKRVTEWIVAPEHGDRIASNFHISERMNIYIGHIDLSLSILHD
jgi:hypothetical protein